MIWLGAIVVIGLAIACWVAHIYRGIE